MIAGIREKSVLVVGGTRGIGRAVASACARYGARVGITGRGLESAKRAAAELGAGATGYALDVRDRAAIPLVVAEFARDRKGIDAMVYSTGISPAFTSGEKHSAGDWDDVLATNLSGAFFTSQAVARIAIEKQRPCAILFIGSIAGLVGAGRLAAYSASKAALVGLAKSLAVDWARHHIRVNVLAPGWVETDMTEGTRGRPALLEAVLARTPQGRMAKPEEIAGLAAFLISDEASFATGEVYPLDGGWTSG